MTTFAPEAPALTPPGTPTGTPPVSGNRLRRLVSGRPGEPSWSRPALLVLLAVTALLYLWDLSDSGYANSFYAAAVQAGSHSWKAMFFGSSDSSNFITVDKPPASLWVMDVSARIFGFNSWSLLVPQALEGVAAVGLLYSAVKRWASPAAGLVAGSVLALTPVAALIFRFDNPDSLLVLLLIGAAYALLRAVETGRTRWLVLAGLLVGTGFLTKMLQAFVVVPVFAGVYLLAGPAGWAKRVRQMLVGGLVLVAASLWWVVLVQLVPAADRPYIGGSQDNSLWNLIFGYNGFGRLTGNEAGSVGGGVGSGGWGATGLFRMFNSEMGGQISWLIPSALILLVAGLWLGRRAARTDLTRATYLVWGGWLLFTGLLFSFSKGIIHPYYTVALAPAIGALVGIGAVSLWSRRTEWFARSALAATVVAAGVWAFVLLDRSSDFYPWVRYVSLVGALGFAAALLGLRRVGGRVAVGVAAVGLVAALAGPAAYTAQTVTTAHTGAIPSAGPTAGGGGGGFGGGGGHAGGFGGGQRPSGTGTAPGGTAPGGTGTTGGGFGGGGGRTTTGGGGGGGLLNSTTPSAALTAALKTDASSYTWVAAIIGSNNAAGYQLASGDAVMAIGGFNGTDPAPSLAQFEKYVAAGKIHYFIPGSTGSSSGVSASITSWVESHYTATTIGGTTVYDLTAAAS